MNKNRLYRNVKKIKHKEKKICNYCLNISSKLTECLKCREIFCKSCLIEINKNKKYCVACMIEYIKKDVALIIEK